MEGFMDVIAAYRAGIENSGFHRNSLKQEHVDHLKRFTKRWFSIWYGDKGRAGDNSKARGVKDFSVEELFGYWCWTQIIYGIPAEGWLTS